MLKINGTITTRRSNLTPKANSKRRKSCISCSIHKRASTWPYRLSKNDLPKLTFIPGKEHCVFSKWTVKQFRTFRDLVYAKFRTLHASIINPVQTDLSAGYTGYPRIECP